MHDAAGKALDSHDATARRPFLIRFAAGALGLLAAMFPFAVGWGVIADPFRRRGNGNDFATADVPLIRVCSLDALPADGVPRQFSVVADVTDAWSRSLGQRIGSVFLMRTDVDGKPQVTAFTSACPHLGCGIDYHADPGQYECPCHASAFAKDGKKLFGPSLRGLDPLAVQLDDVGGVAEILVAFERFRTGIAERIPIV